MAHLKYVQGDSLPQLKVSLESAGSPIDVSSGSITVRAYVRKAGETGLKATLGGVKSTGRLTSVDEETGAWTVDVTAPYNVAGVGGIVLFPPTPTTFDESGQYEVEYEIDYGSGSLWTVFVKDIVTVRPQVG